MSGGILRVLGPKSMPVRAHCMYYSVPPEDLDLLVRIFSEWRVLLPFAHTACPNRGTLRSSFREAGSRGRANDY